MKDYKSRLKNRLYLAIGYIVIGGVMLAAGFILKSENSFIQGFGVALLVCGIVRIISYLRISRDEQSIHRQEIRETDERNLEIVSRARSITFTLYISISGLAVIILQFMNKQEMSQIIAYGLCFFMCLYWICYMVVKRKI